MKNIKHILCITLSIAFGISNAQPVLSDNTISSEEKIAVNTIKKEVASENTKDNSLPDMVTSKDAKPEIKIYPEPFKGIVSVNLSKCPDAQICLFDAKGNCLKYQRFKNEECAIFNLREQPKGIYYMEIMVKGEKTVKAIYLNQNF